MGCSVSFMVGIIRVLLMVVVSVVCKVLVLLLFGVCK